MTIIKTQNTPPRKKLLADLKGWTLLMCILLLFGSVTRGVDPPAFKPFAGIDLIDASGDNGTYIEGETLDVNEAGQAVGWLKESSGRTVAFFFDPEEGQFQILDTTPTYSTTIATGLSEPDSTNGQVVICGYAIKTPGETDPAPCLWNTIESYPDPASVDYFLGYEVNGKAHAVTRLEGISCGNSYVVGEVYLVSAGGLTSFLYEVDGDNAVYPTAETTGAAFEIDSNLHVLGWYWDELNQRQHAYTRQWACGSWLGSAHDIHNNDQHYSMAYGSAGAGGAVGWYWFNTNNQGATYWERVDGVPDEWTPRFIGPPGGFSQPTSAYDGNWTGNQSDKFEIVVSVDDFSGTPGAWIWKDDKVTGTTDLYDLNDLVLLADYDPEVDAVMQRAYSVNNNLWIAGSYRPDGSSSSPRPMLIIPYDTDNNGEPDFREIIENKQNGPDLDAGGRKWLLDKSEQIRLGLHAPGGGTLLNPTVAPDDQKADRILNTQVVRFMTDHNEMVEYTPPYSNKCDMVSDLFDHWGTLNQWGGPKEFILSIKTARYDGDEQIKEDYIPQDELARAEMLTRLGEFSYRFARCIDYIQFGNESFSGNGVVTFETGDLTCDPNFAGNILQLTGESCVTEGGDLLFEWFADQLKTARTRSALAGRPLRFITSASIIDLTTNSYQGNPEGYTNSDDVGAYMLKRLMAFANQYEMAVDQHLHYKSVAQAENVIDTFLNQGNYNNAPWDAPVTRVSLEWGPTVNIHGDWYANNGLNVLLFFIKPGSGSCGTPTEFYNWDDVLNDWEDNNTDGQFRTTGFQLSQLLDNHFVPNGFRFVCYALTNQLGNCIEGNYFDVSTLRTNQIGLAYQGADPGFSIIRGRFETAASLYFETFTPHENGCPCEKSCDSGCP